MATRILLLAGSENATAQVLAHARALARSGAEVTVWAPRDALGDVATLPYVTACAQTEVTHLPSRANRAVTRRLRADGSAFDVIHALGAEAGSLAARSLARVRRVNDEPKQEVSQNPRPRPPRLVVTIDRRPMGSLLSRWWGAARMTRIAWRSAAVLAVSPDLVRRITWLAWPRHLWGILAGRREPIVELAVVPDVGAAATRVTTAAPTAAESRRRHEAARYLQGWPLDEYVILTVSPLHADAGIQTLLDAATHLQREGWIDRPWRWLVVGEGPLRDRIASRIEDEDLAQRVTLLGKRADTPALVQSADLIVSASRWDGQSPILRAALDAGAAIVATDVGGTRTLLGRAGRQVPADDPIALADMIAAVASSELLQEQLRSVAVRRAAALPGLAELGRQLARVYKSERHTRMP